MKASEKHELARQTVARLEREFDPPPTLPERPVLETLIYAVCLDNDGYVAADESFARLQETFHDLNEIRVSSISEVASAFAPQDDAEFRAHRVRSILQFVFDDHYQFDLELVRKKTQEQVAKKLGKIRDLSPFVRNFLQQNALGVHVLPLDDRMTNAAIWLGLVEPGTDTESASESLKSAVRKADATALCHYLRCLATQPPGRSTFDPGDFVAPDDAEGDPLERLDELFGKARKSSKRASGTATKTATKPAAKPSRAAKPAAPVKGAAAKKPSKQPAPAATAKGAKSAKGKNTPAKPASTPNSNKGGGKKPKGRSRAAS